MTTTKQLPKAWTVGGHSERIDALELLPRRVCVLLAAEWARSVFPAWEAKYPWDEGPRKAVEAAEGWAFGTTTADAAYAAYAAAAYAADASAYAADASAYAASAAAYAAYAASAAYAAYAAAYAADENKWSWLYRTYCHVRGPEGLVFEPAWKTDTATALAREIAKTRAFDLMPILADALQDAGCDHAELLTHLRNDADEVTLADRTLAHLFGLWDEEVTA